jgi:hypothetical protein
MTTKNQAYDHPAYLARLGVGSAEAGGGATTQYAKFAAFAAMQAMALQATVTTAGTAAGHLLSVLKVTGTATSTIATQTIGTATQGATFNVPLSTAAGGVSLLQGDVLAVITGADVVGKAAVTYEVAVTPLANLTA